MRDGVCAATAYGLGFARPSSNNIISRKQCRPWGSFSFVRGSFPATTRLRILGAAASGDDASRRAAIPDAAARLVLLSIIIIIFIYYLLFSSTSGNDNYTHLRSVSTTIVLHCRRIRMVLAIVFD